MQDTEVMEREGIAAVSPYERPAEAVFVEDGEEEEHLGWSEAYDVTVSPNDFNVSTLCNFLDKGVIAIPDFQRDFVWDKRKASRFIESVTIGLPVPELFFYQAERNKWWVVDGQQRLMSVYYFQKGRFPRPGVSVQLSRHIRAEGGFPDEMLADSKLFSNFALNLTAPDGIEPDGLHGKSYGDIQATIELRPLRAIVIRQHKPDGDNAAFEIFDRLNTGGVKLSAQQIRACVYQSPFMRMVDDLNFLGGWRELLGVPPDKNQRDTQMILRAFAMLSDGGNYASRMLLFLNKFSRKMRAAPADDEQIAFLRGLFDGFLLACKGAEEAFRPNGKFQISIFEAVFVASMSDCFRQRRMPSGKLDVESINRMVRNADFDATTKKNSTSAANVKRRLEIARENIRPL